MIFWNNCLSYLGEVTEISSWWSFTKCLKKSAMWRNKNEWLSISFWGVLFPIPPLLIPHFYDVTWLIKMWRHKNEGLSISFWGIFFPTPFSPSSLIFMTSRGWLKCDIIKMRDYPSLFEGFSFPFLLSFISHFYDVTWLIKMWRHKNKDYPSLFAGFSFPLLLSSSLIFMTSHGWFLNCKRLISLRLTGGCRALR